jgi:hypothetical protein
MLVKRDHKFGQQNMLAYWTPRRDCCQTSDSEASGYLAMFPEQDSFVDCAYLFGHQDWASLAFEGKE